MSKNAKSLPVLMHHYISRHVGLSMSPELFEENCRFMAENGWRGVGLDEAEGFLLGREPLPEKSFLITFDDGYLDNYIYAWPILRKYGHKGVIFAVGEPVSRAGEEAAAPRPTLDDVWAGKIAPDELPDVHSPITRDALGYPLRRDKFFSWSEARLMEQSGVMAVAGHSLTHQGIFTGPEYEGFNKPGPRVVALPPQPESELFWGCPNFKTGAFLGCRAFIPNPELLAAIKKLTPQDAAEADAFFAKPESSARLEALMQSFAGKLGRYESDGEEWERLGGAMRANQALLQKELGHEVKSFCWPWGAKSEAALQTAQEAGFKVFYDVRRGSNKPGAHLSVKRFRSSRKPGPWLLSRVKIYSRPLLGNFYSRIRI